MPATNQPPGPLAGLRVLDLTRLLPGPVATLHLADLGADVIKIEDTGAGDYARSMGVGAAPGEDSFFFRIVNRNKRGLRLDLKQAAGVAVFLRLARDADVVVESFRPGVVDKLGVGYAAVAAINPRIVYCAITGYGQTGPWRDHAGHDINYVATAGVLDQIGTPGGAPALPNFQIGDLLGGALTGLAGILAAVIAAKATGQGRYVDVSMTDAVFAHAYSPLLSVLSRGRTAPRGEDALSGGLPGYGLYRTQDGRFMAVGSLEPKFWQLFCRSIGRPDFVPYGLDGGAEGARVKAQLADMFARQPLAHWAALLGPVDCGVTPVPTFEEAMAHPQLLARGMVVEHDGLAQFAPPLKMSGFEFAVRRAAPKVSEGTPGAGADSAAILREAGYAEAEIAALHAAGTI
ncbi:MAG: CoA transferase [Gammaproteobacteria bacterium]|nr:CoA transferase [Gammaproteobacteria bacterium]MBU1645015.1 CoA transferase [Gammaproteobacteria bacterium]MBU1971210.1 CoA transferase [Gammaproteobacteria bacterium]